MAEPITGPRVELCGAIYPDIDIDCVCLLDRHDDDQVHRCDAPGCGREWVETPAGRTA